MLRARATDLLRVTEKSAAAKGELNVGERLITINGIDVEYASKPRCVTDGSRRSASSSAANIFPGPCILLSLCAHVRTLRRLIAYGASRRSASSSAANPFPGPCILLSLCSYG